MPESILEESRRFPHPGRRQEYLAGRRLLMIGLERMGAPGGLSGLKYVEGKPCLETGPWFSISHSRGIAACALSDSGEVGLDVEAHRKIGLENFRSWFTADEMEEIRNSGNPERELLRRWTIAEALYKACGEERGDPVGPPSEVGGYQRVRAAGEVWHVYPVRLAEDFEAALVTSGEVSGVSPEYIPGEYPQGRHRFP